MEFLTNNVQEILGFAIGSGLLIALINLVKARFNLSGKMAHASVAGVVAVIAILIQTFVPADLLASLSDKVLAVIGVATTIYNMTTTTKKSTDR